MKICRFLFCFSMIVGGSFANNVKAESTFASARIDYDSIFREQFYLSAFHFFSPTIGAYGYLEIFPEAKTFSALIGPVFKWDGLLIAPAIEATYGPSSWSFSADKTERLGRDIGLDFYAHYDLDISGPWAFEGETFTVFYFPTQESYATAVDFGVMRHWAVLKWNNLGIGPFLNPLFTKNPGDTAYQLSHLPVGVVAVANFEKLSMHLFMGHDPISISNWAGFGPKNAGAYYKMQALYRF